MPGIKFRDNESFESGHRRFKRAVEKSGILTEVRRREYHVTHSAKKQRAMTAAIKRLRKKQMREGGPLLRDRSRNTRRRGPVVSQGASNYQSRNRERSEGNSRSSERY